MALKVIDNDHGEISVTHKGKEIRGWSYANDAERCLKMRCAREFVEGWHQGRVYEADAAAIEGEV